MHETSDLGDGWFNADDVKVTVTVDYAENGRDLVAKVTYDGSSVDAAQFDNKHEACGSADIAVAKLVNGAAPAADQKFDFALSANDDASAAKMPAQTTATTVGAVAATFGSVDFTLADAGKTFSYTIHETTPAGEGWTNAPDVTVTLTVGDDNDGDGKLPVTVEYSTATADGTAALFNNAYKPVVPEKPSVPKTGDETPVEAMALTAAAGATLAATGLFLGLRSRKRNEQLYASLRGACARAPRNSLSAGGTSTDPPRADRAHRGCPHPNQQRPPCDSNLARRPSSLYEYFALAIRIGTHRWPTEGQVTSWS